MQWDDKEAMNGHKQVTMQKQQELGGAHCVI
jgi:hypothetical protein